MTPKPNNDSHAAWESATWEGSRRAQIDWWAHLSLEEIFAAQEELAEIAKLLAPTCPPQKPQGQ